MSILCRTKGHPAALQTKAFAMSLVQSVAVVTQRQIKLMVRDVALTRGRWTQVSTPCPKPKISKSCVNGCLPEALLLHLWTAKLPMRAMKLTIWLRKLTTWVGKLMA